jgi:hypothetical protein
MYSAQRVNGLQCIVPLFSFGCLCVCLFVCLFVCFCIMVYSITTIFNIRFVINIDVCSS